MQVKLQLDNYAQVGVEETNNPVYYTMNKIRFGLSDYLEALRVEEEAHQLLSCTACQSEREQSTDKTKLRPFVLTIEGPKGLIKCLGHR